MYNLDTFYPTIIHEDYLLDPSIMDLLITDKGKKEMQHYMLLMINIIPILRLLGILLLVF